MSRRWSKSGILVCPGQGLQLWTPAGPTREMVSLLPPHCTPSLIPLLSPHLLNGSWSLEKTEFWFCNIFGTPPRFIFLSGVQLNLVFGVRHLAVTGKMSLSGHWMNRPSNQDPIEEAVSIRGSEGFSPPPAPGYLRAATEMSFKPEFSDPTVSQFRKGFPGNISERHCFLCS